MGFHITSIEQARTYIGKRITSTYAGQSETLTVQRVDSDIETHGYNGFNLWMSDGYRWPLPDNEIMFELADPEPTAETPAARVARLRAELAEAEAEAKRVEGAPAGFEWIERPLGDHLELRGTDQGDRFHIFFASDPAHWVGIRRSTPGGESTSSHAPFDALAAFVDRIRRDRGEATPEVAAPVSGAPAVPQAPEGWTESRDHEGPILESDDGRIEMSGGHIYMHDDDLDSDGVSLPLDAVRAFIALCDK